LNLSINETSLTTIENDFLKISDEILNRHVLQVSHEEYRIINVEFYFYNHDNHKDENSHALKYKRAKERQLLKAKWYLHKKSINPKNSYKGLDFTFGNGVYYGGILIKEVINIKTKIKFTQSKFIDELIRVLQPSCEEDFLNIIEKDEQLKFIKKDMRRLDIQTLPRKGLVHETFKKSNYAFMLKNLPSV
jgi:hypothetical protein